MARMRPQSGSIPLATVDSFKGGLNTFMSKAKIQDNESPALQNIEFVENGIPAKRAGTELYGASQGTSISGIGSLKTVAGGSFFLQVNGTKLYKKTTTTWTEVTGVTFTTGKLNNFVQARGAVYIHNGTDTMAKYDGTTLSQPSTGVVGKGGVYYNGRQVIFGNSSNPTRLYMSSSKSADNFAGKMGTATSGGASTITDSGQSWTTNEFAGLSIIITSGTGAGQTRVISSNTSTAITVSVAWTTNPDSTSVYSIEGGDTIDINKDDGQDVTGLALFQDKLVIFKERSIWQLTFDSIGFPIVQLISNSYGCVSHRSIAVVENDLFYLSNDGVRSLGYVVNIAGVIRTNLVSVKISTELDNINTTKFENCAGIYYETKRMYILAFPRGAATTNNRMAVFQAAYNCWSIWTGLNANCFLKYIDSNKLLGLYFGSETEGYIHKMFASDYSDGESTAIDAQWSSKQFDLGSFNVRKRFAFVDIQFRSVVGNITITVVLDGTTTQSTRTVQINEGFSGSDGMRVFMLRDTLFREDNGSTASIVANDVVRRIKVNKTARSIQISVSNATVNESFSLMGISIGYRSRSPFSFDSTNVLY